MRLGPGDGGAGSGPLQQPPRPLPRQVTEYLEVELGKSIEACTDPLALRRVQEVLYFMTGAGRFKKDLGGVDLDKANKKVVATARNKAGRAAEALENPHAAPATGEGKKFAFETGLMDFVADYREEDKVREQRQLDDMGAMVDKAVARHNAKGKR